jgi:hypothetical protein
MVTSSSLSSLMSLDILINLLLFYFILAFSSLLSFFPLLAHCHCFHSALPDASERKTPDSAGGNAKKRKMLI